MADLKECVICLNDYGPGETPDGEIKTLGNWKKSLTCSMKCKAIYCAQGNRDRAAVLKAEQERCRDLHRKWWKRFCFGRTRQVLP